MAKDVPPGFDVNSSDWGQGEEPEVSVIADQIDATTWADVIKDNETLDRTHVRPGAYLTPQEAMRHAYDMPFGSFAGTWFLTYDGEDDLWYIVVDY